MAGSTTLYDLMIVKLSPLKSQVKQLWRFMLSNILILDKGSGSIQAQVDSL